MNVTVVPEQNKFENLDESSKINVDGVTGLAQRLGKDGKPVGDPKPLAELLDGVEPDPKPNPANFSKQAKKDREAPARDRAAHVRGDLESATGRNSQSPK